MRPVEQEEGGYGEEDGKFTNRGHGGQLLLQPKDGCVLVPFAGRGGVLESRSFSRWSETRLTEVLFLAG